MIDLDMGYTHDYHFDSRIVALDYSFQLAIDIAADYCTILSEIVLISSEAAAHNYIGLEIDYDLVGSSDCGCLDNRDFLGNWGSLASAPVGQLAA